MWFGQGDVLLEESEDEAAMPIESIGGFFIKHGTFMGTENDIPQTSDTAATDSDYDTDLDTEGKWGSYFEIKFPFVTSLRIH